MKNKLEENILISISACCKIISIFLGPFLVAYFITISSNSTIDISIYNIINFITLGIGGFIVGTIIKNKFKIEMFRVGVILNFIYILIILLLKENILNYIELIAFLYGVSQITYWLPFNIFTALKIDNNNRVDYEVKRKLVSTIASILIPLLLGSLITTIHYEFTAILILVVSIIQIILSFFLKPLPVSKEKFKPFTIWKKLKQEDQFRKMMFIEFLKGTNLSDGSLGIIITILVFNAFKTNMNLGIITSMTSIFTILISYLYGKIYKGKKSDSKIIMLSSIIPVMSLMLLLLITNNVTIVVYNFCYSIFTNLLALIIDVRLFNTSKSEIVSSAYVEFWTIRELVLNMGRVFSFILLIVVSVINSGMYLNYLLIFLTLLIVVMGITATKVKR